MDDLERALERIIEDVEYQLPRPAGTGRNAKLAYTSRRAEKIARELRDLVLRNDSILVSLGLYRVSGPADDQWSRVDDDDSR